MHLGVYGPCTRGIPDISRHFPLGRCRTIHSIRSVKTERLPGVRSGNLNLISRTPQGKLLNARDFGISPLLVQGIEL